MNRTAIVRWVPVAVLAAAPSILVFPILFSGKMLHGHDVVSVFHSSRIIIAQAFREGRLPVWDSSVMAGFPLLAAVQAAVFYPPTWLCAAMPAGTFLTVSAWMHLVLAGLFAHRWLERGLGVGPWAALAGGFIAMLSGYLVGHLLAGHVTYLWAYPWIPALLWRLERFLAGATLKRGVLLAVVFAMLFLAGVPQYVFFAGLLLLVRGGQFILAQREGRRDRAKVVGRGLAWLALGLAFCAPQLLPTLELVTQMQRGSEEDTEFLYQFSMPVEGLKSIVFAPERSPGYSWEWTPFIGGAAVLLAAAAFSGKHSQRYLWAAVGGVALLLALGTHIPFYHGFVAIVPGAGLFRGPARYLLLFTLAAAALVALGFDTLWGRSRLAFRIPAAILGIVAGIQVFHHGKPHFLPTTPDHFHFPLDNENVLRARCGSEGRVAPYMASVTAIGRCQANGLETIGGYEPMMLRRYAELMNAARGSPIESNIVILSSVGEHPVVDMLSVRAWVSSGWTITDHKDPMPRAWVVNNAVVKESKEERLNLLAREPWDPRKTVILEELPAEVPPIPTEEPAGRAKIVSRRPGQVVLEVENPADAYLVLSEAYYPGWTAEVDGKSAEVLPANHLIQAVRLPPGKHVVRIEYRSQFLGAGVAIAVLAGLGPVAVVLVRRRRR